MKIDEIIKSLHALKANESRQAVIDTLIEMVIELAEHVKAQEPEPLSEEEMQQIEEWGRRTNQCSKPTEVKGDIFDKVQDVLDGNTPPY